MMNNKNTAKKMSINENAILEKYLNTLATPISKHKPDKKLSFIWANDAFYKMTGHEKKDFKIHPQSAAFFLWFFHSRSYRFTIYSGLLYPVDVYPYYPANHSWRRYKVETLLAT